MTKNVSLFYLISAYFLFVLKCHTFFHSQSFSLVFKSHVNSLVPRTYIRFKSRAHVTFASVSTPFCYSLFPQQSKRRSQGLSLDSIYHCLNRTILYQLSRPHKTVPQQVTLLDSLRVLTVNRNLVLGPGNHDQEFVACLAHCLINLHTGR